MESNNLFHNRYFLERMLGRGNFSEVWLAVDTKTNIQVALKIYAPATGLDDAGLDVFAREFSLVVNANHKNLLKPLYYDSWERKPYLVLPYCKKGSILRNIGKFTEEEAWKLLRDVASGLAWLHQLDPVIIHQDIKPDNIMVSDNGDFMITDFGVSTHLKSTLRKSLSSAFSSAGTIAYMAPERFSSNNTPIMANDIYSLGATVYEMLSGDTPFGDDGGLMQKRGAEIPELQGDFSSQLKKVINKCLLMDPWNRPTAEQLENYANIALEGGRIKFVNEKSFLQKNKLWVVIVACVSISLLSFGVYEIMKQHKKRAEMEIVRFNDSLSLEIDKAVVLGERLTKQGDLHDEGFELSYIEAFNNYMKAVDDSKLYKNGNKSSSLDDIELKIDSLKIKMRKAQNEFLEKAEIFNEDMEVSAEFRQRADNIENLIGKH